MGTRLITAWAVLFILGGCTGGHFRVYPVPSGDQTDPNVDNVEGFRYFLPKPYLLVTNMTVLPMPGTAPSTNPVSKGLPARGKTPDQQSLKDLIESMGTEQPGKESSVITAQLLWLPDLNREYAISVEGGHAGTFKGTLQLANGWMLLGVNEEFDTKTAETLNAFSGFLGTLFAASGLPTPATKAPPSLQAPSPVVPKAFLYLFEIDLRNRRLIPLESLALQHALEGKPPTDAPSTKGHN